MDVSMAAELVTTLGFPVVMCGALCYYILRLTKEHKEETAQMTNAINNNTLVIQKLVDKMSGGEKNE